MIIDSILQKLNISSEDCKGTYLIGGAVRDNLMGFEPSDFDIVTKKNPKNLGLKISKKVGGKMVSMGSSHNKIFRILSEVATIDITSLSGKNIFEDILRRDFTINSIAYDLFNSKLLDPMGGIRDIKRKKIRTVGGSVFKRDPLRVLRAYRFSLCLNFTIVKSTKKEMVESELFLTRIPGERIWSEFSKIFSHPKSWPAISDMLGNGIIFKIFPELLYFCNHHSHGYRRIYSQSIRPYRYLETILIDKENRNNSIFHKAYEDIIKKKNYPIFKYSLLISYITKSMRIDKIDKTSTESVTCHNRNRARMIHHISKRLKLSLKQQRFIQSLIKASLHPIVMFKSHLEGSLTRKELYCYFEKYGAISIAAILESLSEITANVNKINPLKIKMVKFMSFLAEQYSGPYCDIARQEPLIRGHELIDIFNIPPSPRFKRILQEVHKAKIFGEISSREEALRMVKQSLKWIE